MKIALALLSLALLTVGFSQSNTMNTAATIQRHCEVKWPNDAQMRNYCQSQQRSAVLELSQLEQTHGGIPQAAFNTALQKCSVKWPGDFEMQAYCLKQQIQGYRQAGTMANGYGATPEETAIVKRHCTNKWPTDYEMQAYCQRQQMEGLSFIKTRPMSISLSVWNQAVRGCRLKWNGDFEMQAYCVKQALGF